MNSTTDDVDKRISRTATNESTVQRITRINEEVQRITKRINE